MKTKNLKTNNPENQIHQEYRGLDKIIINFEIGTFVSRNSKTIMGIDKLVI